MIINYLDELLDNILDNCYEYFTNNKLSINKNHEIAIIIDELTAKISIEKKIINFLTKLKINNSELSKKLYFIYNKYLYIYMLIFIGIKLFKSNDAPCTLR